MPITFFDHTAPSLDANLALDEALLLAAEAGDGGEVLRFWDWPAHAVVLGAGGSVGIDVNEAACRADGVTMHRRASGGGTVLVGRGCLLFSLVLAYDRAAELRDVTASYRWILGRVRDAVRPVAPLEFAGTSDLAWDGRKASGNAQHARPATCCTTGRCSMTSTCRRWPATSIRRSGSRRTGPAGRIVNSSSTCRRMWKRSSDC